MSVVRSLSLLALASVAPATRAQTVESRTSVVRARISYLKRDLGALVTSLPAVDGQP